MGTMHVHMRYCVDLTRGGANLPVFVQIGMPGSELF